LLAVFLRVFAKKVTAPFVRFERIVS
jgi:hypothetical protein